MTAIDTEFTLRAVLPANPLARLFRLVKQTFASNTNPEDTRERRAFVQEMLDRNPDAFASDFDVQSMMQHFPSHF